MDINVLKFDSVCLEYLNWRMRVDSLISGLKWS